MLEAETEYKCSIAQPILAGEHPNFIYRANVYGIMQTNIFTVLYGKLHENGRG